MLRIEPAVVAGRPGVLLVGFATLAVTKAGVLVGCRVPVSAAADLAATACTLKPNRYALPDCILVHPGRTLASPKIPGVAAMV